MGTMKVIGSALYQWEQGRKLRITPAPGATVVDVQFAHPGDTEALSVTPKEENGILVACIPNILLQSGQEIVAFLVNVSSDKVETTSHKVFHVVNRPKPADYAYEETEVVSWRALEASIREFMDEINEARVNGDLKGEPGKDGYTPQKGVDYFDGKNGEDGYTPVKGKDYFDGKDGEPGKDYVLTQSDKEEIAEMAAELVDVPGGGGGGAQADWNAAEGQPGHILNRTHWVENGRTEVLSELVFTSYSGNGTSLKEPIGLTAGKTYIVNWNGVEYKCTAFSVPLGDGSAANWTATAIGDWDSINNNIEPVTGEPFCIFEYTQPELIETFGKALYIKPREDTIHDCTVSIYEESEIIHKLDGKYLPNGVPYSECGGGITELLPPTQLEGGEGEFYLPASYGISLVDGGSYVVNWNGVDYTCTAQLFDAGGESATVIGNVGLAMDTGEDTGEPFVIIYQEAMASMGISLFVVPLDGSEQVTLWLSGSTPEIIHKLDPKFLPDGVPYCINGTMELPVTGFWDGEDALFVIMTPIGLEIGKTYTVNWNGTDYEAVGVDALESTGGEMPGVFLGNLAGVGGEDNGLPFMILEVPAEIAAQMGAYGMACGIVPEEVPFAIYGGGKEIRKLNNDCLDLAWLPTEEKVDTEVMAETTFTASDSKNTPLNRSILPVGTNVAVIFDGVRYECTVVEVPTIGWITFGNLAILNAEEFPNTGEPFCFTNLLEAGPYAIFFADENDHTVSVYVTESTINQMPEAFLPSTALYIGKELTEEQRTAAQDMLGIGDLNTALDSILAMQQALIGGDS